MAENSFSFQIDKAEWDGVIKMADTLSAKLGQKVVRKVMNESNDALLSSVSQEVAAQAENPTGNLQQNLMKRTKRKYEPSVWISAVAVNRGKTRADGKAYYWGMAEEGHKIITRRRVDTGRKTRGLHYALRAYELNKHKFTSTFASRVAAGLRDLWGK